MGTQDAEATIRVLGPDEAAARVGDLAGLLLDAVAHGASVNFLDGLTQDEAEAWWRRAVLPDLAQGARVLIVAEIAGALMGTVQMVPAPQPNQPHRADVAKMLVHSRARRRGLGSRLLASAEAAALAHGRTLLTLDTETGGAGDRLYRRGGWIAFGTVPGYALMPDGSPCAATFFYKTLASASL